jgi:hypothetical protein
MQFIYLRFLASLIWIRARAETLTTRQWGRGWRIVFVVVLAAVMLARPVFAQVTTGSEDDPGTADLDKLFQELARVAFWVASGLTKGVVLFIDALVPIITYNNFSSNPVVSAGWAIVRDTVNMFFVVVLIVIAFGTIFGHSKFQWQQQVPRLMIFALVINFSKTLTGIMIDFGQVIMLTFANAIREIAAGNFLQLLGLNELYQISDSSSAIAGLGEQGAKGAGDAFEYFAGGVMAVGMIVWVLATMIILTVILLYRIIMLWVMIVLAPLAWFMGGVGGSGGIISSNAYDEWWKRFKCLVAIGPVLTFFLWLTLAVAGAGNIAQKSGFDVVDKANNANFILSFFEAQHFLSFLIGMAMLYAGFEAAQTICTSMPSLKRQLGRGQKAAMVTSAAAGVAGLGLKAGAYAGRKAGGAARSATRYAGVKGSFRGLLQQGATYAADKTAGTTWARPITSRARGLAAKVQAEKVEEVERAGKKFEHYGSGDVVAALSSRMKSAARLPEGKKETQALIGKIIKDPKAMKETKQTNPTGLATMLNKAGRDFSETYKNDAGMMKAFGDAKKQNVDLLTGTDKDGKDSKKAVLESMEWKDLQTVAPEALKDKGLQDRMAVMKSGQKDKEGNVISAIEALAKGHGDKKLRDGWNAVRGTDTATLTTKDMVSNVNKSLDDGDLDAVKSIVQAMVTEYSSSGTSDEQRFNLASGMDSVVSDLKRFSDGLQSAKPGDARVQAANDLAASLQNGRAAAEDSIGRSPGVSTHGVMPAFETMAQQTGFRGDRFVQENFSKDSSDSRLSDAAEQIAAQVSTLDKRLAALTPVAAIDENNADLLTTRITQLRRAVTEQTRARFKGQQDEAARIQVQIDAGNQTPADTEGLKQRQRDIEVEINQAVQVDMDASSELKDLQTELGKITKEISDINKAKQEAKSAGVAVDKMIKDKSGT